jgi:hypothetical protein
MHAQEKTGTHLVACASIQRQRVASVGGAPPPSPVAPPPSAVPALGPWLATSSSAARQAARKAWLEHCSGASGKGCLSGQDTGGVSVPSSTRLAACEQERPGPVGRQRCPGAGEGVVDAPPAAQGVTLAVVLQTGCVNQEHHPTVRLLRHGDDEERLTCVAAHTRCAKALSSRRATRLRRIAAFSRGRMSDASKPIDFDTNPYEVLGLGAGAPTLSAEDIKKVRPGCAPAATRSGTLADGSSARPGVSQAGAGTPPGQASTGTAKRCAPQHTPGGRRLGRMFVASLFTSLLSSPVCAAAEREFNELQKAYDLLWCVFAECRLRRTTESTCAHSRPHTVTPPREPRGTATRLCVPPARSETGAWTRGARR